MNRYRMIGKFSISDAVEAGDVEEIIVTNPVPLTGNLPPGVEANPDSVCEVRLQCKGSPPSPDKPPEPTGEPIILKLEFDAEDLDSALEWGSGEIETRAAILSVLTLNRVNVESTINCVEITPGKTQGLESGHGGEFAHEHVVLDNDVFRHVMGGTIFNGRVTHKVAGSFRWFRKGLQTEFPEDAFLCFWIALEMIATEFAVGESRFMLCPRCQNQFETCPNCHESTEMKPQASEGIISLFRNHLDWSKKEYRDLNRTRGKLMHGGKPITESFRHELIASSSQLVSVLLKGYEVLLDASIGPEKHPLSTRLLIAPWGNYLRTTFSLPEGRP